MHRPSLSTWKCRTSLIVDDTVTYGLNLAITPEALLSLGGDYVANKDSLSCFCLL